MSKKDREEDRIYRVIELVGSSSQSIEDAINVALGRAHKTLRNLRWFEVVGTRGQIEQGKAKQYGSSRILVADSGVFS